MSDYSSLKATINANVKANNNHEITGSIMNSVLNAMVDSLGAGYQFMGMATPATNPGTPDEKVFYLASVPGVYPNFGNAEIETGTIAILYYDGAWSVAATNWRNDPTNWYAYVSPTDGYMYIDSSNILHWKNCHLYSLNRPYDFIITDGTHSTDQEQSLQLAPYMLLYCDISYVSGRTQYIVQTETFAPGAQPEMTKGQNLLLYVAGSFGVFVDGTLFSHLLKTTNERIDVKQIGLTDYSFTDNSLTINNNAIYVQRYFGGSVFVSSITPGTKYEISGTQRLVMHTPSYAIEIVNSAADVVSSDIVLLYVGVDGKFAGGALYQKYLEFVTKKTEESITLDFEYGSLRGSSGTISNFAWDGFLYKRTPRYLNTNNQTISVKSAQNVVFYLYKYDNVFSFVGVETFELSAGVSQDIPTGCAYCKFQIAADTQITPSSPVLDFPIVVTGKNLNWVFNEKPSDDGYINFRYPVNLANAASGNNDAAVVQDQETIGYDYGLLVLPSSYSQKGKPTRLIIYCHGAGAGITSATTRFNANNMLRPEYWLSQGYAIMDVDGNPFDKDMPHWYIPQAYQSYMNAYKWVVRNFNIANDGVFLGGRSMGGGMALGIINNTNIPVKAAFLISPNGNLSTFLNVVGAARHSGNPRQFIAEKYGCVGSQPAWTLSNPMTADEWNYFKANYYRLTRYVPFLGLMTNLPDVESMMDDNYRVNAMSTIRPAGELDLYETIKIKTRIPIKIFTAQDDDQAIPSRNAQYLLMELEQGGNICEYRSVPTGGHFSEMNSANQVTFTDKAGNTLADVPIFYIEALQFCRRYEETTW